MTRLVQATFRSYSNVCRLKPYKATRWLMPDGNPLGAVVYNCVAGEKVPVILSEPHVATWYSCGPTVYDAAHLGHASCYVKLDILQRILKNFLGVKLITAMGVTDIDDKIIKKANDTGSDFRTVAKQYEHEFWLDMSRLGVEKPQIITRVSEHIPSIEKFVRKLIDSGVAYAVDDGSVFFDTTKYGNYGKLQKMQDNSETKVPGKKNEMDFALWKGQKPGEPSWEAEWGKGRPGWHIECSAMVSKIFGSQVDFHAGGVDLQFPHHENEECQSCAYHRRKQWTNYWLHVGHLHIKDDVKMSKSLKNTISISDLLEKRSVDSFRMACLLSNYRNRMEYSDELMETADSVLSKFKFFLRDCEHYVNDSTRGDGAYDESLIKKLQDIEEAVDVALRDDFDTSKSVNTLLTLVSVVSRVIRDGKNGYYYPIPILLISEYVNSVFSRLGVNLRDGSKDSSTDNSNAITDTFVEFRHSVRLNALSRKDKDLLIACDIARDKLKSYNIQINDSKNAPTWILAK